MKVLVCGGRAFGDEEYAFSVLDDFHRRHQISLVVQGGAKGADAHARRWAKSRGIPCKTYYAEWRLHKKAAGPIRNQRMLDEEHPEFSIAFPGNKGTADMVRRLEKAQVGILKVKPT